VLSVTASRELQAVALAVKTADRTLRRDINAATRDVLNPVWQNLVAQRAAASRLDGRVFGSGARIKGGNPPELVAASSRRRLRGGLVPREEWRALEFGRHGDRTTTYTVGDSAVGGHSRDGRPVRGYRRRAHKVTRHTYRQLPARAPKGRVLYQAAADILPRAAALWAQLVVSKYAAAAERR